MRLIHFAAILALALMWGASFMFVAVMVREISPVAVAWIRLGGGAAVILAIAFGRRAPVPRTLRFWRDVTVLSLLASTIPFFLIPLGQRVVPSSLAAILNSSVPIWAGTLAYVFLPAERLSMARVTGLLVGFVGVAVVIGPGVFALGNGGLLGQLEILLASACYGAGAVYFRRHLGGPDSTMTAGIQSAIGFLLLTPVMIVSGATPDPSHLSSAVLLASAAVALMSSGVAIVVYYWLLHEVAAAQATATTYLVPITAVFWGWSVLGEHLKWTVLPGLVLIILGVWLLNRPARVQTRIEELPLRSSI